MMAQSQQEGYIMPYSYHKGVHHCDHSEKENFQPLE